TSGVAAVPMKPGTGKDEDRIGWTGQGKGFSTSRVTGSCCFGVIRYGGGGCRAAAPPSVIRLRLKFSGRRRRPALSILQPTGQTYPDGGTGVRRIRPELDHCEPR